jgi:AraC family transcriptional regulator
MIITIPSHRQAAEPRQSHILHERASSFAANGAGALSIKCFFGGSALYSVGPARYRVDSQRFLLLNQDTPYSIAIDSPTEVESFCVFFSADLVSSAHRELCVGIERLLADPAAPDRPPGVVEQTYPHGQLVSPMIHRLRHEIASGEHGRDTIQEQLIELLSELLVTQKHVRAEMAAIPAARPATRHELYRRLAIARDYADAMCHEPIGLSEIAAAACLSPTHLLRSFRQAFGQSPYQFLTEKRIQRAMLLLRTTALPVTEICAAVSFESLGTFSSLFRRRTGVSPSTYRRQTW